MSAVVTQADRERAAEYKACSASELAQDYALLTQDNALVQAFARHRSEAVEELVEVLEPFARFVAVEIRLPRDDETGDYVVHLEVAPREPEDHQPSFKHWTAAQSAVFKHRGEQG